MALMGGPPAWRKTAGDTPQSAHGEAEGAAFSAFATNVDGGYVVASASEGISDVPDYNDSAGDHYYGWPPPGPRTFHLGDDARRLRPPRLTGACAQAKTTAGCCLDSAIPIGGARASSVCASPRVFGSQSGRSARIATASTALANAVLRPLILLLNLAVEICCARGLGNAGVRQGFPGRRQVTGIHRLARRIAGRCWDDASVPAGLLGPGRKP
jgi:hypothetical protein